MKKFEVEDEEAEIILDCIKRIQGKTWLRYQRLSLRLHILNWSEYQKLKQHHQLLGNLVQKLKKQLK